MKQLIIKRIIKSYKLSDLVIKELPIFKNITVVESTSLRIDGRQRRFLTPEAIQLAEFNLEPVKFCMSAVIRSKQYSELFNINPSMTVTLQGPGFEIEVFIDSLSSAGEYEGITCVDMCFTPV
ncbi:MAG: hypothetical protein ACJASL_000117 [Paraglaciecola sp.]|jgi:hypothetical protein